MTTTVPTPPPRPTLPALRETLSQKESERLAATRTLAAIDAELRELQRTERPQSDAVVKKTAERVKAKRAAADARQAERDARQELLDLLTATLAQNPRDDVDTLSAAYPIVFFPVRIETRFDIPQVRLDPDHRPNLMIRVYPDEITATTHEPALTPAEVDAGAAYWIKAWNAADEPAAWRQIVALYPPERAAWIVQKTEPTNIATRGTGNPQFPAPDVQAHSWTRPGQIRVLPDRWMAIGYRDGNVVQQGWSRPVLDPLAITVDPSADENDPNEVTDVSGAGLKLDKDIEWTVDFAEAERVGMAFRLFLDDDENFRAGLDQLFVFGVKASLPPDQSADRIAALFDSHHYTRGFAFVRQGTPTNNTAEVRSGHPPSDLGGERSLGIERGASLNRDGGNGRLFAAALGVPDSVTDHVAHADLLEQANARAMAEALWPCTFGYFLRQMMDPVFDSTDIAAARNYFINHVRGRGPLPSFRIGGTPYGLLPVTSLERWQPGDRATGLEKEIGPALRTLVSVWSSELNKVPRIGRTPADPDGDLLTTLGLDASTRTVRVRPLLGPAAEFNLFNFFGIDFSGWFNVQRLIAQALLRAIGRPNWDPLIAHMTFESAADLFAHDLVQETLSETEALNPNYIQWIRTSAVYAVRGRNARGEETPRPLLYHFLRHAALTEYAHLADDLLIAAGVVSTAATTVVSTTGAPAAAAQKTSARPDAEFVGFQPQGERATAWQKLDMRVPTVTGTMTIAEYLVAPQRDVDLRGAHSYRRTLQSLESLPSAELERLFTETMDVCSHRLDAWVTSLASKKLREMRNRAPQGVHIAAYAWVEDLRPLRRSQSRTGGYVQAPTMTHAATAAVLRNAYLTRSAENQERYSLDVSSKRVRTALWILDAVREGQPLGAVLGYQFERGLHEGHEPLDLNKYIDVFRRHFPLVANKRETSNEPADVVAARNVVDGMRLRDVWRADAANLFNRDGMPPAGNDRNAIIDELRKLEDSVDAVADLLTAEGVFQVMRGNVTAASASLETLSRGVRPPDPELARQPRGGTTLTHRFGVVLGTGHTPAWAGIPASPRSTAEPRVDAWIGLMLGDPATIRCVVSFIDPANPPNRIEVPVSLAGLQLRPVDFLALALSPSQTGGASELDLRVAAAAVAEERDDLRIDYSAGADRTIRSFPEAIEIATAIRDVIGGARPLTPVDLLPPEKASAASAVVMSGGTRVADARAALETARDELKTELDTIAATDPASSPDLTTLRTRLRTASAFGVSGAYPITRSTSSPEIRKEMLGRATTALSEMNRRLEAFAAATTPSERVHLVFGREFVFLEDFTPAEGTELAQAMAVSAALVGTPAAPLRWFQKTAPVRPALTRWRKMAMYAQLFGTNPMQLEVVQLPHAADARWIALPFPDEASRPPSGRVSIVLHRAAAPAANAAWAGLIVDEWSEIIPSESEQTAVAFHYDDPGAEAPQAVLIGVPPANQKNWDFDTVLDTLRETLHLAKVRAADSELLGLVGQMLPAIYLASNPAEETVSTQLTYMLQEHPVMVRSGG